MPEEKSYDPRGSVPGRAKAAVTPRPTPDLRHHNRGEITDTHRALRLRKTRKK